MGQPFRIPKWQRRFIKNALAPENQETGLSIARKNGKTGLCAAWSLAYLCGPFNRTNWRGTVCSLDADLAKEFRRAVQLIAEASGFGTEDIRVLETPTPGRIIGRHGATLDILASGKGSGHARGSDIVFVDEAGLLQERERPLWNALFSSISGRDGKFVCLSIQGDGPMFAELKERADDPSVYFMEFASDPEDSIESRKTWHKANPGLKDGIKTIRYMEGACRRALRSPGDESYFRAYDLNQPRDPGRVLIVSPEQWKQCMVENPPERRGDCYVGLDAGEAVSMTACSAYWPATGRLETIAAFPSKPSLKRRGEIDGIPGMYERMEKRGELRTFPGVVTPLDDFVEWVYERLQGQKIAGIAADNFKKKDLKQSLLKVGIKTPVKFVAMAWKDASTNCRFFQKAVISEKVKSFPSLLMTQAIADSALEESSLGVVKLDRSRARGKIDALASAILAVGEAESIVKPEGGGDAGYGRLIG